MYVATPIPSETWPHRVAILYEGDTQPLTRIITSCTIHLRPGILLNIALARTHSTLQDRQSILKITHNTRIALRTVRANTLTITARKSTGWKALQLLKIPEIWVRIRAKV